MKYYTDFSRGKWNKDDFWHAGICAIPHRKEFEQEDDCVTNGPAPFPFKPDASKLNSGSDSAEIAGMDRNDFAFTFYVLKNRFKTGITVKSGFGFESYGSPTFVFGLGVEKRGGVFVAKDNIEVTFWEEGINYWFCELDGDNHNFTLLKSDKFKLPGGCYQTEIRFEKSGVTLDLGDVRSDLAYPVYDEGYAGFIGCEGSDRFYSLSVEQDR